MACSLLTDPRKTHRAHTGSKLPGTPGARSAGQPIVASRNRALSGRVATPL